MNKSEFPLGSILSDSLPVEVSSRVFAMARVRRLRPGQSLFSTGDLPDGCYRVDSGVLKLTLCSEDGDELVIGFAGPGSVIGELALHDGLPRSATATAVTEGSLSFRY
jgi:CRP/FNR family transcriptional regulator